MLADPRSISTVAVIGTGTIGASWAAYFLARGIAVRASDPAQGAERALRRFVGRVWPTLEALGLAQTADPERITFFADPAEAVCEAQFVQESAPERQAIKVALYERLDGALPAETVLASSSSGLLISELQAGRRAASRYLIGHPFNPPHLIPLVEVVGGKATDPEAVAWALDFYSAIGKRAIHVRKEVPGHLANRLQAALWREAVHAVADGVADVADVDAAIAHGPGLRWALMGPHLTFALAGGEGGMKQFLQHFGPPLESWWADLGEPRLTPEVQQALIDGIAEETAGRSLAELVGERDRRLLALLQTLAKAR